MPSPVGHSLSGLVIYLSWRRQGPRLVWVLPAFILLANLPDLDFLPGWIVGQPNLFHRGASHSLFTALLVGLVVGGAVRAAGWGRFLPAALTGFAIYASHVVLDLFSVDTGVPRGFAVLWPLTGERYLSDVGLFLNIRHSPLAGDFLPSLVSEENLRAVANEIVLFLPVVLLFWGLRGRGVWWTARGDDAPRGPVEEGRT